MVQKEMKSNYAPDQCHSCGGFGGRGHVCPTIPTCTRCGKPKIRKEGTVCLECAYDLAILTISQGYDREDKLKERIEQLEAENERIRNVCRELEDWFKAYPIDVFQPLKGDPIKKTGDYDTKEKRNLITRASASMARHMIGRIPGKIRGAITKEGTDETT